MGFRIGEEDIAGEGDEGVGDDEVSAEEIGAIRRLVKKMRARPTARRPGSGLGLAPSRPTGAVTPYGEPVMAREEAIRADLYQQFGLGFLTNALAGVGALTQNFIERFKTGRLLLTETAPGNIVNSIFIGIRPQGANLGAAPVAGYAGGAFETRVSFDTGEIGWPFTVNVTTTAAAQTIAGMAFGSTIKRG